VLPLITCQARKVRVVVFWLFVGQQVAHVTLVQTTLLTSRQMGWGWQLLCIKQPEKPNQGTGLVPSHLQNDEVCRGHDQVFGL
jgi:hypothetical protein